ncbi:tetratricopeptide repeat protein [Umezawaea endophytica]|uniref:Tetratricopeptide repeat protein n=2 Tax=Umezawaea endophytica TaxID=1654476 RepID=A0A9X2VMY6_9PSEU|nr:tetratricopeptide repeat protein [Umezawaea endophytica]
MLRDHFADAVTAVTAEPTHHRDCLVTTWERSLDLLHDRGHPLARPLLRLLSTFAPAPVPCALLDAAVLAGSPVFAGTTPTGLAALVSELAGLGLVEVHHGDLDTVSLHPLVRDITRHHVDDHDPYTDTRLALLHRLATRAADPSGWSLWRALLPHCEHERLAVRSDTAFADLCHSAGGAAYEHGFSTAAERLYRRALRVRLDLLGPRHPDSLATRHNLAVLHADDGDPEAARAEFCAVLADQVAVLGECHPDVLTTRRDLARTAWACGEHAHAEAEYREIEALQREVLGENHPDTLITRYETAAALHDRGDPGATTALRALLHDQVRVLGHHHAHTLITRHRLARACHDDLDQHHVVRLTIAALGPEHPITLTARTSRAVVARGEDAAAELRDVLEVLASRRGPDHPETLASRHNLRVATDDDRPSTSPLGRRRGRIRVVDPVDLPAQRRNPPRS